MRDQSTVTTSLQVTSTAHVATVVMNRPHRRNALSSMLRDKLLSALAGVSRKAQARTKRLLEKPERNRPSTI